MSRRAPHRHGPRPGSASSPRSPVLLGCDVIGEGEELTAGVPGGDDASLRFLRQQRRLLSLSREFVLHQMRALEHHRPVEGRPLSGVEGRPLSGVEGRPLSGVEGRPLSGVEAACLRLQELCHGGAMLQRRVRANQLLHPLSPPVHRTLEAMRRTLRLTSVKAAVVTEELVLRAVRCAARRPEEVRGGLSRGGLSRALTLYNRVIAEVSPWSVPGTDVLPMPVTRSLEIVAEERARLLIGRFSSEVGHRLEDVLKGEAESPEVGGALLAHLETLLREDWGQVAPLLEMLAGPETVGYEKYCSQLWPLLCAHLYQALYPGRRGGQALPALAPSTEGARTIIHLLLRLLTSDAVPEQSREHGRVLCHQLLSSTAVISWDRGMCRALGLALTDKCVMDDGHRTHSRTAAALVTVCQEASVLLWALSSGSVSGQSAVLCRSVTSLQLCDLWLRSRAQMYTSSGSVRHLLLISHGDAPVIREQLRRVTGPAAHNVEWSPASQRLHVKLQNVGASLEGVALSLPRLLDSVCSHQAQAIFQHMMPSGRHWRGKVAGAPDLVPSEYAQAAISAVLVPVLEGIHKLAPEEQTSAVSGPVEAFMEAWLGHILQERLRFSLQGALQLRCDFECVRNLLKSPESGMSREVVQSALSLPVFQQADNAIVCLLQQPSRKAYLQSRGCSVFCCPPLCRTAVESVSDSLQSLDSLGRRVWSHNYPAPRPRHSHDSYLPHNQRQWLSLRLHKSWTGLG